MSALAKGGTDIPRYNGNTNRRTKRRDAFDRSRNGTETQSSAYEEWEAYTRAVVAGAYDAQPQEWHSTPVEAP